MPRTAFTAGAHRDDSQVDRFESVELDTGECGRFWVPSEDLAWMELVHNIRAPIFDEAGKPVMTIKRNKPAFETDGVSRPICLGDPDVIKADELDPGSCPACAVIREMLDAGLADARDLRPQWRYALPVISYDLANKKSAEGKLRNPPNGRVQVWPMTPWIYRKLDDTRAQTADLLMVEGGKEAVKLQMSDIMVHCENGQFKTYDRMWPLRAAWKHDSDAGRRVKEVLQALWAAEENRPTDAQLRAACGREPDKDWMRRDMEDAQYRWDKAVNGDKNPVGSGASSGGQSLAEATDALLADGPPADDDLMADHPGGTAEFASPDRKAELAAAGSSLFDDAPPVSVPAPASAPADDGLFGGAPATTPPPPAPASAPAADDGLFGGTPPAAANGSGTRATQSFTDLIEAAEAG